MRSKRGVTVVEMLAIMAAPTLTLGWPASAADTSADFEKLFVRAAYHAGCSLGPAGGQTLVVFASSTGFGFETACAGERTRDRIVAFTPDIAAKPDTITFFFQPDSSTDRTDDFALMRRVNGEQPVAELNGLLVYPGRPFMEYYYRPTGEATHPVPATWLPLRHTVAGHGTAADTGVVARIDLLRAVEVNYSMSNGGADGDDRVQPYSSVIGLANLSSKRDRLCGDEPSYLQSSWAAPVAYGLMPAQARTAVSLGACTTI